MDERHDSSSNGSNSPSVLSTADHEPGVGLEFLSKSDGNLEKLLFDVEYDYTDAEIVVEGISVGVNRCILALRSQFFHELFMKRRDRSMQNGKPSYILSELGHCGNIGYETFMRVLNYFYTGKLNPPPPEVSTCIDDSCAHDACAPAISYAVELMYASATFQIKELVEIVQHRLLNSVDMALVEDIIPISLVAFHCHLNGLLSYCTQRIAKSELQDIILEKELPHEVSNDIKSYRNKYCQKVDPGGIGVNLLHDKRIVMIYEALDSNNLELLKSLLDDSDIALSDNVCALHYAVAYCDPKFANDVLSLDKVNVNRRNSQGYTMLHVAAMRKDPSIIMGLITNGASASYTTNDGKTALTLCRRMTKPKDYNEIAKQGREWSCINLLEKKMADDLQLRFLILKDTLGLARLLFPSEASLPMPITDATVTSNLKDLGLNETPSQQIKILQSRVETLQKIVETGRRLFPNCYQVLDSFINDGMQIDFYLENCSPEERKKRFLELKEEVRKAFDADKLQNKSHSSLSSPSESDTLLLERARNLLRGNTKTRKKPRTGIRMASNLGKAANNVTSFSSSSSHSISPSSGSKKQFC